MIVEWKSFAILCQTDSIRSDPTICYATYFRVIYALFIDVNISFVLLFVLVKFRQKINWKCSFACICCCLSFRAIVCVCFLQFSAFASFESLISIIIIITKRNIKLYRTVFVSVFYLFFCFFFV